MSFAFIFQFLPLHPYFTSLYLFIVVNICMLTCLHMYDGYTEYSPYIEWLNECLYSLGIHLVVVSKQFFPLLCAKMRENSSFTFSFPFVYFYGYLWCCSLFSCIRFESHVWKNDFFCLMLMKDTMVFVMEWQ
jgi:hypothetical protein